MKYHFSFERKAIVVLACGALLTGVLVFAEGILVGLDVHVGRIAPLIVQAPKLKSPLAAPPASGSNAAPAAAPAATATAAAAAAGAPPAAAAAPEAAATQAAATCGTQVPTGASVGAPIDVTGSAPASAADGAAEAFAIQMGAFLEAANASKLVADLKGRGCTAAVISQLLDPSHRMWNVVRIGPFPSLQAAARAAQDVQRSQGVLAIVRPADSM